MTSGLLIPDHFMLLLPVMIIGIGALGMLILCAFSTPSPRRSAILSLIVLVAAAVAQVGPIRATYSFTSSGSVLAGIIVGDTFGGAVGYALIGIAIAVTVSAWSHFEEQPSFRPEFFALVLFSLFGMLLAVMSTELLSIVVSLEIASAALYALVGLERRGTVGAEALFKFLVLGAFSVGFGIMGIAFIYGQAGSTMITDIVYNTTGIGYAELPLLSAGALLLIVMLLFKLAAFPMHAWAPDVYEGAPMPIAGFISAALTLAAGAVFVRLVHGVFMPVREAWFIPVGVAAVGSMVIGNFLAIGSDNVKRILSGAGIAHAGVVLAGIACISEPDSTVAASILVYLAAYAAAVVGLFAALISISEPGEPVGLSLLRGLGHRRQGTAAIIALFVFSFIGVPPTVGFLGKYALVTAILDTGHPVLAVAIIASTGLSLIYFLRIIAVMYFTEHDAVSGGWFPAPARIVMFVTGLGVAWSGFGTATLILIPGAPALVHVARYSIMSLASGGF